MSSIFIVIVMFRTHGVFVCPIYTGKRTPTSPEREGRRHASSRKRDRTPPIDRQRHDFDHAGKAMSSISFGQRVNTRPHRSRRLRSPSYLTTSASNTTTFPAKRGPKVSVAAD